MIDGGSRPVQAAVDCSAELCLLEYMGPSVASSRIDTLFVATAQYIPVIYSKVTFVKTWHFNYSQ